VKPGVKGAQNRLPTRPNIGNKNRQPFFRFKKLFINSLGLISMNIIENGGLCSENALKLFIPDF
jgi:hypothetical protein